MGRRVLNNARCTTAKATGAPAVQPISGVTASFLSTEVGYIKQFEVIDPHRAGPQDTRAKEIEQYRIQMLQTRQCGISAGLMDYFVITTPNFVLDHEETISQNVGGQQWKKCKNLLTNRKSLSRPQGTK
uniref:Small ribosomal subunit protein uS8c n=1 Tax=Oryza meridionalis TaxID=40149 RepID=A0A0E0BZP9_9ORYZ